MVNNPSQPLGACKKIINFILTMLSRPSESLGSNEVPIEEGSLRNVTSSIRPINELNGQLGSDITVEFRHTDGSIKAPKKNGLIEQTMQQKHVSIATNQGKWLKDVETLNRTDDRGKGITKNVTIEASDGDKNKKEAKRSPDDDKKPVTEAQRQLGPLMSINEMSDSYIRRKKKDMGKNYSFDHDKS